MVERDWLFVNRVTDHAKIRITTVRIAVARFELICCTPTLASTAVSPAKNAESNAQPNQFIQSPHILSLIPESERIVPGFEAGSWEPQQTNRFCNRMVSNS